MAAQNVEVLNQVEEVEMNDTIARTVVTASAKLSPVLTSTPLQVMKKEDFAKLGIKELHEAVRTFSGVQIKDYGGIGGVKTVSVRSMGSQHTAICYDGVTVSNAQSGQVDIGRFNLSNVETVVLSIGQADDIFQSARMFASAGALSIRTSEPVFDGKRTNAGVAMAAGSFGTYNPSMYFQQKLSGKWACTVNADWLVSDGEYPFTLVNGNIVTEENRLNSDVNTIRAEANVYGNVGNDGKLMVKGNYLASERGLPGSVILYNKDARERLWDETWFAQANYITSLGNRWRLQGQMKYNYAWNKYQDKKEYYPDGVKTDRYTQKEIYGAVSVECNPAAGVYLVLSQDYFRNSLDASYKNFAYPRRNTSLTALAGKYSFGRFAATASLLATYISEDVRSGAVAKDRFRLSPALNVSYKLFREHNVRLRASYKDIFRTPTFNDLYYDEVGNKMLKPEIARQFNVGLTWQKSFGKGVLENVSLQADGFFNKIEDKIVALPTLFVWKMMNMGKVDIWGTDVNLEADLGFGAAGSLHLHGSYSYQHAVDVTSETDKNYKDQIPYTPRHSGNVTVSFINRWVNVGYVMSAVGERYALPQNTGQNRMGGYAEHSVSLERSFETGNCMLQIQLQCQNITDKQYDVIQFYPMPGRSFRFTLKLMY